MLHTDMDKTPNLSQEDVQCSRLSRSDVQRQESLEAMTVNPRDEGLQEWTCVMTPTEIPGA